VIDIGGHLISSRARSICPRSRLQVTVKAETAFPHERYPRPENRNQEDVVGNLLYWAVVFLIVAVVAALFGFGAVAGTAMVGAKILFWVAIVLFIIALIGGLFRRGI
jgi:uncharacterized membrane protein YtjA (UPF0391 family)